MDALDGRAAEGRHIGQADALALQPFNGLGGVVHQGIDQRGIVDALAADHGVQREQLGGIEVALGIGLPGVPLFLDRGGQGGDGLVVRPLLGGGGEGLLDARGLAELVLVLIDGLGGVHAAGGLDGVAAHGGLALHHDHAHAGVGGVDGGGHARTACADDHHVGLEGLVLAGLRHELAHVVVGIHARLGQRGFGGLDEALAGDAGEGRAGVGVHDAVVVHHYLGPLGDDVLADAVGLAVAGGLHGGDHAVLNGDGHGHVAAEALGGAGAGLGQRRGDRQKQHGRRDQQCEKASLHGISLLRMMRVFPVRHGARAPVSHRYFTIQNPRFQGGTASKFQPSRGAAVLLNSG